MSSVAVTKMHGTLNDFVVVDQRSQRIDDPPAFARFVCDRRGGVGADGVILLSDSARAHARMRIINADGSEAEMCGNGMRCAVRYLCENGEGECFNVETLAGLIGAEVLEKGEIYSIRLNVGVPLFEHRQLPFDDAAFVWVGNPHVVVFERAPDAVDLIAAARQLSDLNVHAVSVLDRHRIRVRHHERGVGLTQACGTGSVACAAAAMRGGLADSPIEVLVPGGTLRVDWDGTGAAFLTGPAVRVFDARLE